MKRIAYAALVAAALMIPAVPQELGKMIPVEVIKISTEGDAVLIEADTGDVGRGVTVESALWDLKASAPGSVYLDTAEYLLLPEGKETILKPLIPYLQKSVRLCCWEGEINMEEAALFLDTHSPKIRLKEYDLGMPLEILSSENGRMKLKEKTVEIR